MNDVMTSWEWWADEASESAVYDAVRRIEDRQACRRTEELRNARLYANANLLGLSGSRFMQTNATTGGGDCLSLNIVRSCCDSLQNQIVQSRVRPFFVSNGGDQDMQKRAQKLSRYCEAAFRACKVDEVATRCLLDCLVFQVGVAKVFSEYGKLKVERCYPGEVLWDDQDGAYGDPRCIYHVRYVDRAKLKALFPKKKTEITDAPQPPDIALALRDAQSDQVLVVEAWHLRSGPDATDGRHVIALQGAVLKDSKFEEDEFPFLFLRFTESLLGFGGTPLASLLVELQRSINRLLRDIETSQYLLGNARVYLERGSKILHSRISTMIGGIVEYTGTPPQIVAGNAIDPQAMQLLTLLYAKAFEIAGISQMMAQGTKPTGLEAGAAIRAFVNETSGRFMRLTRSWEAFHVGIAERMIRENRALAKENPKLEMVHLSRSKMERIPWAEVAMDEEEYLITNYPTSALPKDPAGRLAKVGEWINAGWISKEEGFKMADVPDLDAMTDEMTSGIDLAHELCDRILEDGEPQAVEEFYGPAICFRIGVSRYRKAKLQRVDEERLDLLRDFIVAAQQQVSKANPAPQPAQQNAQPPGLAGGAGPWANAA